MASISRGLVPSKRREYGKLPLIHYRTDGGKLSTFLRTKQKKREALTKPTLKDTFHHPQYGRKAI
jgi:hypothetical protein